MPYKSEAQRRAFHALLKRGKLAKSLVDEFDRASEGLSLPEKLRSREKTLVRGHKRPAKMNALKPLKRDNRKQH